MVLCMVASLGFATIENFFIASGDLGTALGRAFTAVPAHAAFGAIMGYTFARRHLLDSQWTLWSSTLATSIVHGVYDWMLFIAGVATELGDADPLMLKRNSWRCLHLFDGGRLYVLESSSQC